MHSKEPRIVKYGEPRGAYRRTQWYSGSGLAIEGEKRSVTATREYSALNRAETSLICRFRHRFLYCGIQCCRIKLAFNEKMGGTE